MATKIDVSALTLNAEEASQVSEVIVEKVFAQGELSDVHDVQTGIQHQKQIVFAGNLERIFQNQLPLVNITSPLDGADFHFSVGSIDIVVEASDIEGSVAKVEFFEDGNKVAEDDDGSDGWSGTWTGWDADDCGVNSLTAKATDNEGDHAFSPAVEVTMTCGK